jgi:hypothetical protein
MANYLTISVMLGLLVTVVGAAVPQIPSMNDYSPLLKRSPFIIKKVEAPSVQPKVNNSLTLKGLAKLKGGWFVTVVDRKSPKTNIVLREGKPANSDGIRLVKVNQNKSDYKKTTAVVMSGGRQMTITYNATDIKNSIAKATKSVKATPRVTPKTNSRPPIPTAGATKPSTSTNSTGRRPRVRRTTPPPVPRTK